MTVVVTEELYTWFDPIFVLKEDLQRIQEGQTKEMFSFSEVEIIMLS